MWQCIPSIQFKKVDVDSQREGWNTLNDNFRDMSRAQHAFGLWGHGSGTKEWLVISSTCLKRKRSFTVKTISWAQDSQPIVDCSSSRHVIESSWTILDHLESRAHLYPRYKLDIAEPQAAWLRIQQHLHPMCRLMASEFQDSPPGTNCCVTSSRWPWVQTGTTVKIKTAVVCCA